MWSRQTKTTTFGLSISRPLSHIWPDHYWRLRSQRHFHNSTFSQTTQIDQRPRCTIDGLLLRQPYQDQRIYRLPLHLQVLNGWGLRSSIKQFVSFFLCTFDLTLWLYVFWNEFYIRKVIFIQLQEFPTPPHCCCCSVTKWSDSGIAEAFKWNIQCGCENASKQLFHLFIISNLRSEITHENWEDIIQKSFLNVTTAIMKEISGLQ